MNEKKQKQMDEMTREEIASLDADPDGDHGTHMPDMIEDETEESSDGKAKSDRDN